MNSKVVNRRKPERLRFPFAVLLALLAGCVQQTPIPYFAGPGDTIVLGIGGIERNSGGANTLTGSDVSVRLTNNTTGISTTLSANQFFKAYPDYSSGMNLNAINGSLTGSVLPFDGGWFFTTTLPNDGTLLPGAYTISITSPTNKLTNTNWCFYMCEGNLNNIPLQVVSSTGADSGSFQQQLGYYTTFTHLDISPNQSPDSIGYNTVAGLQVVITFPAASYNTTLPIIAMPYSHNPAIALQQNIVDNANGTKSLVALLSAPRGFTKKRTTLTPALSDLSLSFFFFTASGTTYGAAQQLADFQIDQVRSHYYDMGGNIITQLSPVMTYH